jgi:hypothetical protein
MLRLQSLCMDSGLCHIASTVALSPDPVTYDWSQPMPAVTSMTPAHGPIDGGYNVVIEGTDLGLTTGVVLHTFFMGRAMAVSLPLVVVEPTRLVVEMAPAAGAYLGFSIETDGGSIPADPTWSFDPPTVTGVGAAVVFANAATTVEVHGVNLGLPASGYPDLVVTIGSSPCTEVEVVNSTLLRCLVPPGPVGSHPITGTSVRGLAVMLVCGPCGVLPPRCGQLPVCSAYRGGGTRLSAGL